MAVVVQGMGRTILSFIRALIPEMHHSFGDRDGMEAPHITVPLYKAAETFIVTPPGRWWVVGGCPVHSFFSEEEGARDHFSW